MKHYCKNTVAINFLALSFSFSFFGVWKWEHGQEANTFLIKMMNPTGLLPAISFLQHTLMTWTLAPQTTVTVINWVTWRRDGHSGSDFRIINSLRLPVLLTCRILSRDLPWLWPHCPSLSVPHHAPHWPPFHVLDKPRSSQLALQARGVPSPCYTPC